MSTIHGIPGNGIVGVASGGVVGTGSSVVGIGSTSYPIGIYTPTTTTTTTNQYTLPGIFGGGYSTVSADPLSSFVTPIGEHFVRMYATMLVKGPDSAMTLGDILALTKNIKYMTQNGEIILHKPIWEALQIYIKGEDCYAGLTPVEYLDKMFAPK